MISYTYPVKTSDEMVRIQAEIQFSLVKKSPSDSIQRELFAESTGII